MRKKIGAFKVPAGATITSVAFKVTRMRFRRIRWVWHLLRHHLLDMPELCGHAGWSYDWPDYRPQMMAVIPFENLSERTFKYDRERSPAENHVAQMAHSATDAYEREFITGPEIFGRPVSAHPKEAGETFEQWVERVEGELAEGDSA